MNNVKTIWILSLVTVFVLTVCWSMVRLTLKTERLMDTTITVIDAGSDAYKQAGNWLTAFFPPELCTDINHFTREYYQQYGKEELKAFFDMLKGEAARRKLSPREKE